MAAAANYRRFCRICGVAVGTVLSFKAADLFLQERRNLLYARQVEDKSSNELQLVQVQIAFRHGARTPVVSAPQYVVGANEEQISWDKNKLMGDLPHTIVKHYVVKAADGGERPISEIDKKQFGRTLKGGASEGQLTKVGQQQMYNIGQKFKEHYINQLGLVGKQFNPNEVFLRTTNIQRTIDSLRCIIAGMFGQEGINVPAVAITFPAEEETWYPNLRCDKLKSLAKQVYHTMELLPGYGKDMIKFAQAVGKENEKINLIGVRDVVVAMMAHGMPVSQVIKDNMDMIEKRAIQLIHTVHINVPFHRSEVLRLGVGNFLEDIHNKMQSKISGESKHKLCLYSVHDTSLITLLSALDIFDNKWPAFGATVAFELYSDKEGKHFVKVLYNEQEQTVPECGDVYCPLERFKKIVSTYAVEDWAKECLPAQH